MSKKNENRSLAILNGKNVYQGLSCKNCNTTLKYDFYSMKYSKVA